MRTWRFHCAGCPEEVIDSFDSLSAEREAAVAWVQTHDGHGLGGFVTPVESDAAPADITGAMSSRALGPESSVSGDSGKWETQ